MAARSNSMNADNSIFYSRICESFGIKHGYGRLKDVYPLDCEDRCFSVSCDPYATMFNVVNELAITSMDDLICFIIDAIMNFCNISEQPCFDLHYTKDTEERTCYIYRSVEALKNINAMLSQTTYLDIIQPTKDECSKFLLRLAEQLKIVYAEKAYAKRHCPRHSIAHHDDAEAFCQANGINYTTYSRSDPGKINLDLLEWLACIELEHILESIKHTVARHLDNFS